VLAALGVALALPAVAAADGVRTSRTLGERELQRVETQTLGAEHAEEHAAQRRAARWAREHRTARRAPQRRLLAASDVGAWDPAVRPLVATGQPTGVIGIHAALLPTGKVMWFSYPRNYSPEAIAVLWNPATGGFEDVPPPVDPRTGRPLNIWCGAQSLLSDGRLLVTGGNLDYARPGANRGEPGSHWKGLNVVLTFDPFEWERTKDPARAWQRHANMRHGRWYPSQLLMPDGRTLILQGLDESGIDQFDESNENPDIEVFDPRRPDRIELLGTVPRGMMGGYYPHTFWLPSGRALIAGPETSNSWLMQPPSLAIRDIPDPATHHTWGSGVMLPLERESRTARIMQIGGSTRWRDATNAIELYDEATNAWGSGGGMNVGRGHHNTVLLPNDAMVTIGGGYGNRPGGGEQWAAGPEHKPVELFDPATGAWKLGPAQQENRAYHSTALLLPDGSVVSAGDDATGGTDRDSYEIYRPPYFFNGARPATPDAPDRAGYGRTMTVRSPDAGIVRAALVAPGAATHAVDMSQRMIRLGVRAVPGGYAIATPTSLNVALPGYYMLFLIDAQGRPSAADWVLMDPAVTTDTAPPPPAAPARPVAPRDTAGPRGRVRIATKVLRRRALLRGARLTFRLRLDEPGTVRVGMRIYTGVRRKKTLVRKSTTLRFTSAKTRIVRFKLSRKQRLRLRTRRTLRLEIRTTARDAAGNVRRTRHVRRLR